MKCCETDSAERSGVRGDPTRSVPSLSSLYKRSAIHLNVTGQILLEVFISVKTLPSELVNSSGRGMGRYVLRKFYDHVVDINSCSRDVKEPYNDWHTVRRRKGNRISYIDWEKPRQMDTPIMALLAKLNVTDLHQRPLHQRHIIQ